MRCVTGGHITVSVLRCNNPLLLGILCVFCGTLSYAATMRMGQVLKHALDFV